MKPGEDEDDALYQSCRWQWKGGEGPYQRNASEDFQAEKTRNEEIT